MRGAFCIVHDIYMHVRRRIVYFMITILHVHSWIDEFEIPVSLR